MKYYAVKNGRKVGIYTSWDECKLQVSGFSDAKYKSFETKEEAEQYMRSTILNGDETEIEAYVDGSFNEIMEKYSFGCVILKDGKIVHTMCDSSFDSNYIEMRNVAGELEAAKQAIKWALNNNAKSIRIYHDYEGIASWANGEWSANKQGTQEYVSFIEKCRKRIRIEFAKVKGHSGQKYNEMADKLAREGLKKISVEDWMFKFEEFVKKNGTDEKRFSFMINGTVVTEKMIMTFVKCFLKEKKYKKVTNLRVQYCVDEGYLDILFQTNDGKIQERKIRIFE